MRKIEYFCFYSLKRLVIRLEFKFLGLKVVEFISEVKKRLNKWYLE